MSEPKKLKDFTPSFEKDAPNIEAVCPDDHPLEGLVTKLLQQGLQGIETEGGSVVLDSYDKKSYGAEIDLSLAEAADCKVTMNAILLDEGKVGNPVLTIDSSDYVEEILDGNADDLIRITGKKVFFSLSSEAQLQRITTFGSSTAYRPYPQITPSSWGEPTVPAVSAEGFLISRDVSAEEEAFLYEYLEKPTDIQLLALAIRCTPEDRAIRNQKRENVKACVMSDKKHRERMQALNEPSGVRPFPADRC